MQRLNKWHTLSEEVKRRWVDFFDRLWRWTMTDAEKIRALLIHELGAVGESVLEYEPFQELLEVHPDFNLAFVRAVVKEAKK